MTKQLYPVYLNSQEKFQNSYRDHLKNYPNLQQTNVFRAFDSEFFHDGEIEKITPDPRTSSVALIIDAPNFWMESADTFLSVKFKVVFFGVSFFSIEREINDDSEHAQYFQFIRAEFNTLGITDQHDLKLYDEEPCFPKGACELLLDCVSEESILIGLKFTNFIIHPRDPTLFYLLCKESGFDHRIFNRS